MIYWISILSILTRIRCLTRDTHVKQPNHDERVSMIPYQGRNIQLLLDTPDLLQEK